MSGPSPGRTLRPACIVALCLVVVACSSTPIALRRVSPPVARRASTADALSAGEPSNPTRIVLRRHDLTRRYHEAPADALDELHQIALGNNAGADEIFALAELSYLYAEEGIATISRRAFAAEKAARARQAGRGRRTFPSYTPPDDLLRDRARSHFLASALYAYAFVLPENRADRASPIDPRIRIATDLYNSAITRSFKQEDGNVHPRGGLFTLPFGTLEVAFDPTSLHWGQRRLIDFLPLQEFEVLGLNNSYEQPGIGAPLAARSVSRAPGSQAADFVSEHARVAATAFLRIPNPRQQLRQTHLTSELEIFPTTDTETIRVGDEVLPLETQPSAAIAASLGASRFWEVEYSAFFGRFDAPQASRLFGRDPYVPGKIPIVLVHGTASTPGTWANLMNDLQSDPRIRHHYQFWFFSYESGNPILYSSMHLRQSLKAAVARFEPLGRQSCLHNMVVIGHSQGGLLTKMTAIDSGSRFWEVISSEPFDQVSLPPETRAFFEEGFFVEPLPFVSRVIFISTPHRGSYLAGPQIVRRLAARLIELPSDIVDLTADMTGLRPSDVSEVSLEKVPTSIDNMSPGHPFIRALSEIPLTPEVAAHSIIAVRGDGPIESGSDGVVRYSSAHIEGVESELVVRSTHAAHSNPHTVEEVRRILLLHAENLPCSR